MLNGIWFPEVYRLEGSEAHHRVYHDELHTLQTIERLSTVTDLCKESLTKEQIFGLLMGMAYHDSIVFLHGRGPNFSLSNETESIAAMLYSANAINENSRDEILDYEAIVLVAVGTIAATNLRIHTEDLVGGSWPAALTRTKIIDAQDLVDAVCASGTHIPVLPQVVACAVYADLGGVFSNKIEERISSSLRHFWETRPDFITFANSTNYSAKDTVEFLRAVQGMSLGERGFLEMVAGPRLWAALSPVFSEEVINNLLPMRTRFNEVILDLEARLPLQKALGLLKSLENVYPEEQPQMLLNEEQKKELGSILYALSAPTLQQDS